VREPSGGPFGSKFVDGEYEEFLQKLIGQESWRRFKPSSAWGPVSLAICVHVCVHVP